MSDRFIDQITAAGFSVFPCATTKKPMTTNGYKAATKDRATIEKWEHSPAKKLWGIPAEPNGFFAVDVDPDGLETWREWTKQNGMPEPTPWQRTPRGGAHYLFRLPDDCKIPNNAGKIAPGIDLRSTGYICTGDGYEWQISLDRPVADAPGWLLNKITAMQVRKPQSEVFHQAAMDKTAAGSYWLNRALQNAKPGNRNQTGFDLALQLRDSGLTELEASAIMEVYAAGVPQVENDAYTNREAQASLTEAYRSTPREPATLPRAIVQPTAEPKPDKIAQSIPEPPEFESLEEMPRYVIRDMDYILADHPPIKSIIDTMVEEGSVNVWVGKYGSKKTWAAISAAVCVAHGKRWLNLETKQCGVLIVDEESGERRLATRIKQALAGELIQDPQNKVKFISGAQFNLLKRQADQDQLIMAILDTGAQLVFIDAFADIMAGGDENAVKDTQPVFMALRRVAKLTGAAIVVIHHANRMGDYRGSSAIPGALETMVQIESKEGSDLVIFKSLKIRDGEPIKFGARAVWVDGQFYMTEVPIQDTLFLPKSQQFALDYFTENGAKTLDDLVNFAGDLYTENTLRKAIQMLINNKLLTRIDDGGRRTQAIYGLKGA